MVNSKIFISHIGEEREIAKLFKDEISRVFLGMPEIFVSSDNESIKIGSRWLEEIDKSLEGANIILILCSEESVKRPWVNFEAGAGWIKRIPVIPVCHTDMELVELPVPLNALQGIEATNPEHLEKVMKMIGESLGAKVTPNVDYKNFINKIEEFEEAYGTRRVVRFHVDSIVALQPSLRGVFYNADHQQAAGYMPHIIIDKLTPHLEKLSNRGFLEYSIGNSSAFISGSPGVNLELNIITKPSLQEILNES